MLQRDGAILDEGDRLTVALHRHHDVEAGLADFPQLRLRLRLRHLHDAAGQAEIGHQLDETRQVTQLVLALLARELDQQDRFGLADQRPLDHRPEGGIGARQLDHRAVDQLHSGRLQLHDVLGAVHRLVEAREVHDAQRLVLGQRREVEREPLGHRQRALAADQQVREVHRIVARVGPLRLREEDIEIIAADPAHDMRVHALDLVALGEGQLGHLVGDGTHAVGHVLGPGGSETRPLPIGQQRVDRRHVVHHVPVTDRARAAGIVAGHAAQRALRRGRDVDRIPEPVRLQPGIELVEHDARLDRHLRLVLVEAHDLAQVLRAVDHQRVADRLPTLRRARAPRQDRRLGVARHVDDERQIGLVARHHHAHRLDLVDRRIGRVAPARGPVEQDLALQRATQILFKLAHAYRRPKNALSARSYAGEEGHGHGW